MAGLPRRGMAVAGAAIALVGVLAFAVPVFTTEHTTDVAKVGDLRLTAKDETSYAIPPFVGPSALIMGLALIGVAFVSRRKG